MTTILVTIRQKGARVEAVEKLIKDQIKEKYPQASITFEKHEPAESRSDRFSEAQSMIIDAKSEAESLRDELQEWLDNLPENLQSGSKADELQDAISNLEEFISHCEDAENDSVDFPGMY